MNKHESPLKQYLELYGLEHERINAASCRALRRLRASALSALNHLELPARGSEGYESTSMHDLFAPDFGLNIDRMCFDPDLACTFRCDVPHVSTLLGVVVNDVYRPTATLLKGLPQGVTMCSFGEAEQSHPEWLERLGELADTLGDAPTALNSLLAQDGVLVHVDRGVQLDKPLQLVNIFNSPVPMLAPRRVLIVMEPDSRASLLLCEHSQNGDVMYLDLSVTEIFCGERSRLDICHMQESSVLTNRVSRVYARQQADSRLSINGTVLDCGVTRNDFVIDLAGPGCESMISGMVTALDSMHVDQQTLVRHHAPHCRSHQLLKYVLDDQARGQFRGLIVVDKGAVGTEAFQTNRNLLAAPGAKMHSSPRLEIYCDDVKCSHGATTGQLDERAMFYMQARGIPRAEARMMLMQAFMADVIDTIDIEGLRDRLRHLVDRRLNGEEATCNDCSLHQ